MGLLHTVVGSNVEWHTTEVILQQMADHKQTLCYEW